MLGPLRMSEESLESFDPLDYGNIAAGVVRALLSREAVETETLAPFEGAGIYALYYRGPFEAYRAISGARCRLPIYVGKAVPAGARKGADGLAPRAGRVLYNRLRQHRATIEQAENLIPSDFKCRFLVVKEVWIPLAEQVLVNQFKPVWNTVLDGFGNHPPGSGRRAMRRPRWDIVHPGREWAARLEAREDAEAILAEVRAHLARSGEDRSRRLAQDDG